MPLTKSIDPQDLDQFIPSFDAENHDGIAAMAHSMPEIWHFQLNTALNITFF